MDTIGVAFIALLIFGYALTSKFLVKHWISGPMFFAVAGVVCAMAGVQIESESFTSPAIELLAEITLVILLFSDATRIDMSKLMRQRQLPLRLLGIGLPLTVLLGTGVGALLFPAMPLGMAAVLAAALAPTDAALGEAVVTDKRVPSRIRQSLNVESGLNDGLMAPMITIFIGLAGQEENSTIDWARLVGEQVGFGIVVGLGAGAGGAYLMNYFGRRDWVEPMLRQLAVVALAIATYALATEVGGNGFVATFLAGMVFGSIATEDRELATEFAEDEGQLLTYLTFFFWALKEVYDQLGRLTVPIALYVVLSLTVIRMVPVAIAVTRLSLRPPTVAFLGWFGPRGLASIIFGVQAYDALGPHDGMDLVMTTITWTVFVSIVAHGLTAVPFARAYGRWFSAAAADEPLPESHDVTVTKTRTMQPLGPHAAP